MEYKVTEYDDFNFVLMKLSIENLGSQHINDIHLYLGVDNATHYHDSGYRDVYPRGVDVTIDDCTSEGVFGTLAVNNTGETSACFMIPKESEPEALRIGWYDIQVIPFHAESAYCFVAWHNHCREDNIRQVDGTPAPAPEPPNLERADLAGEDLVGIDLTGANLRYADLSGADLRDAVLFGADMTGADLTGTNLRDAILIDANLRDARLTGAHMYGAHMSDANLSDANLSDANLTGANLRGADLANADLAGIRLNWANLWGADLRGADLANANLTGANLNWADLSDADLGDADLRYANLYNADLLRANLLGVDLTGVDLADRDLRGVDLVDARLVGSDLSRAVLRGADLSGADLSRAVLRGADLSGADLSGIHNWNSADLSGIILRGVIGSHFANIGKTVSHTLTTIEGSTGAIRPVNKLTFLCTEYTAITKVTLGGIPIGFASYVDLKITTDKDRSLYFGNVSNTVTADIADEPFGLFAGNFDVSGRIPGMAAHIIITYDTVNNGICKWQISR